MYEILNVVKFIDTESRAVVSYQVLLGEKGEIGQGVSAPGTSPAWGLTPQPITDDLDIPLPLWSQYPLCIRTAQV